MDLNLIGKVIDILPEQSGESKNGPWRKQEFILETEGKFPKPVCIVVWGDNIDEFKVQKGEKLTASIDIASREYNGRWYTDVKAWKVQREEGAGGPPEFGPDEPIPEPPAFPDDGDDELPF